jgi:hypothetical protein
MIVFFYKEICLALHLSFNFRKNDKMNTDLLSEKITDIVTADTKSGGRKKR